MSAQSEVRSIGPFAGALSASFQAADFREALATLETWVAAHGGRQGPFRRSRVLRWEATCAGRPVALAVKAFGSRSALHDALDALAGSKAARTWRAACFLREKGIGTPPPVGYLERWEGKRLRAGFYLSVYQDGCVSFREELVRLYTEDAHCWKLMAILQVVADAVRAMHDAGFVHNDLGNQNIFLRRAGDGCWDGVQFMDLNRGRAVGEVSHRCRARDLSRLALPSDFLRVFKEMYWRRVPPRGFQRWERWYRAVFDCHTRTRPWRHPLRWARQRRMPRACAPAAYPAAREFWIWDERSGQPVAALRSRDRSRHYAPSWYLRPAAALLVDGPRAWTAYRAALRTAYQEPQAMKGAVGLAVDPRPETWDREKTFLRDLGPIPLLVRLYHHETPDRRRFRFAAVRDLAGEGHAVSVSLVQDRRAVTQPRAWRAFVDASLAAVADVVDVVEAGHAVNRVKWGLWSFAEYRRLMQAVAGAARDCPGVRFTGPAVIDFEYPFALAALRALPDGLRFAALSHHLYVDRRGAPENRQHGFGTLEKLALARAIARVSRACDDRLIVSEVNWPLKGTGVYSPVGSPYTSPGERRNDPSVDETAYAAYMLRYLLIASCSGFAERVYWWRLAAHGYGLVDDRPGEGGHWRPRPAFEALRHALRVLGPCRYVERHALEADGTAEAATMLVFETASGARLGVAWAVGGRAQVAWPEGAESARDMLGRPIEGGRDRLALDGCPVYLPLSSSR